MNPYKQQIKNQVTDRLQREMEVLRISRRITYLMGVDTEQLKHFHDDVRIKVGDYDIVKETRIFTEGWVNIWEIVQRGEKSWHPEWSDFHGTATINLPPSNVVNYVLQRLEKEGAKELPPPEIEAIDYRIDMHPQNAKGCLAALLCIVICILLLI